MDLLQLKYFQTVARREHITQAAKELNIAQPSLSQTIARLEDDLGVSLFDRLGRNIRLNEAGRTFLQHVERAFTELEKGKREAIRISGNYEEVITVASIHLPFVSEMLAAFVSKYPETRFRFHQGCYNSMKQLLKDKEIDLCVSAPPIELPNTTNITLLTEELKLLVPTGHPLANRDSVQLIEVEKEAFIGLKAGFGLRDATDGLCQKAGYTPNVIFEVEDPALLHKLVRAGIGISFIPSLWELENTDPSTVAVRITDPNFSRTISLTWPERQELSPSFERFRIYVVEYFHKLQQRLASTPAQGGVEKQRYVIGLERLI
ncbi:LysR family transcriptional regulator [Paenibacillus sp. GSMTC-2017]|uniref:LysR family transcriptional regulator n=1 Tax=Paenibacillus sp. GSMTC-2017 TaxID=2794350 RepID=UPI0018D8CDCA|nr:LysR family transcriptional regulator [Paenibacillus sp. GSMTC-2017]MBH5318730.1 LysR family transcriptional regulator [Paenibacillus sp. GSMTC-2017]